MPCLGNKDICRCPGFAYQTSQTVPTIMSQKKGNFRFTFYSPKCMFLVKVKNYGLVTKHACLEYIKKFVYIHKICLQTTKKTDDQSRVCT